VSVGRRAFNRATAPVTPHGVLGARMPSSAAAEEPPRRAPGFFERSWRAERTLRSMEPRRLTTTVKALLGAIALLALLALGILTRSALVTRHDLQLDRQVAHLRFPLATDLALALTASASEVAGIALLVAGALVLVLRRRRWDAVRLVGAVGGAWVLGLVAKSLIDRSRPPATLWLLPPDSAHGFPSGHDTTACAVILIAAVVLRGTGRFRVAGVAAATLFAIGVGASRVYLGDHYATDVLGSWFTVAAAGFLVWAATDAAFVRRSAAVVLREPLAPASAG
jgi:undecaprenyl-diphosphatase